MIDKDKVCLIISCMQKEFLPTLVSAQKLIDSCLWLIDFATHFDIPVIVANHKKLGEPVEGFLKFQGKVMSTELTSFSCLEDNETRKVIEATGRSQFLLAGAETHISILQSAVSFKKENRDSYVIRDTVSARNTIDHDTAIQRMDHLDIPIITREMLFFECVRYSEYPNYIDLSLKFLDQRYLRYQ